MRHFRATYRHYRAFMRVVSIAAVLLLSCSPQAWSKPGDKVLNRPYADQKRWHFGFSVGTQFQDLKFTHNGFITDAPENGQWFVEIPSYAPVSVLMCSRTCGCTNISICVSHRECILVPKAWR